MSTGKRATMAMTAAVAAALTMPAIAGAATVTVTGDDGAPVALTAGTAASIRNMNPDAAITLGGAEQGYKLDVAGPVSAAASPRTCSSSASPFGMDFQGNGAYTINVTTYTNSSCTAGAAAATYPVAINASVALTAPAGPVLIRAQDSVSTLTHQIPVALNPGALTHELRIALGGVLAPDGSIAGASEEVFADTATGTAAVRLDTPGTYLMVGRATGFTGAAGQFFSPWSAPITIRAFAPFDIATVGFPDGRGPRYTLRGELREKSASGKVRIQMARGSKGKLFSVGKAKLRRGVFKKSFTLNRAGTYRVKFTYKGGTTTAPGTTVRKMRISRRIV